MRRGTSTPALIGLATGLLLLAGCGSSRTPATSTVVTAPAPTATAPATQGSTAPTTAATTPSAGRTQAQAQAQKAPPPQFKPRVPSAIRKAAGDAVQGFYVALADGNGAKACGLLASRVERALLAKQGNGQGCAETLAAISGRYPEHLRTALRALKATDVAITRTKGRVSYTLPGIPSSSVPVVREGGVWKVAAFGSTR